jgi:hypothetical protein
MTSLGLVIPSQNTISDYFMFEISEYKARTHHHQTILNPTSYTLNLAQPLSRDLQNIADHTPNGYQTSQVHSPYTRQIALLFAREIKIMLRDPMNLFRIFISNFLMIFLIGLVFLNQIAANRPNPHTPYTPLYLLEYFIEAQGTMFVSICVPIISGIFAVALVFPEER